MEELLTMTNKDIDRLKEIRDVIQGKLTRKQASERLSLSVRQIGRLKANVIKHGNKGIIHGLRGKPSNHQFPDGMIDKAISLIQTQYADFGPTFAGEKLMQRHGITVSVSSLRTAMIKAGAWRANKPKARHRQWRKRRSSVGELVQLDGSEHDWFEGRGPRCVLVEFIDDATSDILYAQFVPAEDTVNLMTATKHYLLRHGRPIEFYVDKDSIYKINRQATVEENLRDEQPITQFRRALNELGISMIFANSPQAKGRVERSFKTHQDRLVKELRLANISDIDTANQFLHSVYIPQHNRRFAVLPESSCNAHRPLLKLHNLDEILAIKIQRVVANDFTVRFDNRFFQLLKDQPVRLHPKSSVLIETRLDGSLCLTCNNKLLSFKELPARPYMPYYATHKSKRFPHHQNTKTTPRKNSTLTATQ